MKKIGFSIGIVSLLMIFGMAMMNVSGFGKSGLKQANQVLAAIVTTSAWIPSDLDPFYGYQGWPNSSTKKSGDNWPGLIYALSKNDPSGSDPDNNARDMRILDVNGDGLADILYAQYQAYPSGDASYSEVQGMVYINQGNNTYKIGYKCVVAKYTYYGDCAAI